MPSVGIFELSMVEDMSGAESWERWREDGESSRSRKPSGGSQHVTSTPQRFVISVFFLIILSGFLFYSYFSAFSNKFILNCSTGLETSSSSSGDVERRDGSAGKLFSDEDTCASCPVAYHLELTWWNSGKF